MHDGTQHRRRSVRMAAFDYGSTGAYFITIVTHDRRCTFGEIVDGTTRLSEIGLIVRHEWANTALLRTNVELDAYVIMPNHVHAILWIVDDGSAVPCPGTAHRAPTQAHFGAPAPNALGTIVGGFKSAVTKRARLNIGPASLQVWQRNYHEHVVRNEAELQRIRQYIIDNPAAWADDEENPERIPRR